jgi:hypothetical protein
VLPAAVLLPARELRLDLLEALALRLGHVHEGEQGGHSADRGEQPEGDRLVEHARQDVKGARDEEDEEPVGHNGDAPGDALRLRREELADNGVGHRAVAQGEHNVEHADASQGQPAYPGYVLVVLLHLVVVAEDTEADRHRRAGEHEQWLPAEPVHNHHLQTVRFSLRSRACYRDRKHYWPDALRPIANRPSYRSSTVKR